ncbi:signal recognition particle-docking protein FtsY [Henriciella aquimarina]|uniref:signal recognition particle-docking protein FtsY n=1 Tax=Henriciella aquimarina TaxID=545261 RepID=UPI0018F01DF7|nr:signal recognition particle-docking protein FtsY [Henriciella aquimarina]
MILWFGKKKKKKELEEAGAAMTAPELSAEEVAAKEAAEKEEAERKAAEQAEIDRKVVEANRAWEERQQREREAAEAEETRRKEEEARQAEEAQEAARHAAEDAERKAAAEEAARKAEADAAEARRAAEEAERLRQEREEAEREEAQRKAEEAAKAAETADTAEEPSEPDPYAEVKSPGFFKKLTSGLSKSSSKLGASLTGAFTKRKLDDEALEELEDLLIASDMGARVAAKVTANLAKNRFDKDVTDDEIKAALAEEIEAIMKPRERLVDFSDGPTPRIVLFVGVNGSGKTTTIGKIASKLKEQGASALLVAGDTFRAAAIEQLTVWGERAGIPVMSKPTGADAAGLVYEAVEKAKAENLDLVLVDTAGRLQNKAELMSELAKIVRVTRKLDPEAPHDVILVLDATVGQNALSQVEAFRHTAEVSGIVMTKLDGTAKGGVLVAIAEAHDLPIHFIGVGEKAEDLQPFSAEAYAKALVGMDEKAPA